MPKFKIAFEVLHEGKVIVEKHQTYIELSTEELAGPNLPEAAKLQIERMAAGTPDDLQQYRSANDVRETFDAAGSLIGRFIEVKLRDWAKAQS